MARGGDDGEQLRRRRDVEIPGVFCYNDADGAERTNTMLRDERSDPMSDTVLIEKRGGGDRRTVVLSLSNPEERNALTSNMRWELMAALAEAEADPEVKAVMLRGEGEKAFCTGGSMSDMAGLQTRDDCDAMCREGAALLNALGDFSKPIIAAVSGWCVGDGFELALCCDLIYAAENAVFCMPEVDLGLTMGWGGAVRLARRANLIRTKELLMLGTRLSASEAREQGIINRVFPTEEFYARAEEILDRLAEKPPQALRGIKSLLSMEMLDCTYAQTQEFGVPLVAELMMHEDFHRAVASFMEKKQPRVG